jgi:gas vesicle protein
MKNESKIILGFLLGALAGGSLGVLFAPYGGKRTRKRIKKNTNRLVEDAKDTLINAADNAAVKVSDGIKDLSNKGAESIIKAREKVMN